VGAVYWPVVTYGFLSYDDIAYVTHNEMVRHGFTREGIIWSFGPRLGFYHPLTLLSLMADTELYGSWAGGFHLTSLLLHLAATLLLLLTVRHLTGSRLASVLVAGLFGLHPMNVQPVVWIAARKEVLAGLFWVTTLLLYAWYARRPAPGRYLSLLACYGLGLLAKPSLVALPLVLLVLDYWPLGRWRPRSAAGGEEPGWRWPVTHLVEKLPLLLMGGLGALLAVDAMARNDALTESPIWLRLLYLPYSLALYLLRAVWPLRLALHYPHPGLDLPLPEVTASFVLVLLLAAALARLRHRPWLLAGGAYFLIALLPVIGIVQIGSHLIADRYAYLPFIGLYLGLAGQVTGGRKRRRWLLPVLLLAAMGGTAAWQRSFWREDERLYRRALALTRDNYLMSNNLGNHLMRQERYQEARPYLEEAVRLDPRHFAAQYNMGRLLARDGRFAEAAAHLSLAVELKPDDPAMRYDLAVALTGAGSTREAIACYREALRQSPGDYDTRHNLALLLLEEGQVPEALAQAQEAVGLRPGYPPAHLLLGETLRAAGRREEALRAYRKALELDPSLNAARSAAESLAADLRPPP
jgi:tetratricopeptide (TPR) repeat protein